MPKPQFPDEVVQISRLGCMKKSTRINAGARGTIEHIEVWVPDPKAADSSGPAASPKAPKDKQ